ncbi:MAG: ATP-binding protein [Bacteroidales bacterium]|nr:ATP-binding protein [Bacteroidales bacterium]
MDNTPDDKILLVNNKIDELTRVARFLEELGEKWNLPDPLVFNLNLVMEEALANTILYGFSDDRNHTIEIQCSKSKSLISITIKDDGIEYDPTQKKDPDMSLPAGERPIGGLGIFLIKKIMDSVHYKRIDNINNLILTKNI